jgi:hypothetical protein
MDETGYRSQAPAKESWLWPKAAVGNRANRAQATCLQGFRESTAFKEDV